MLITISGNNKVLYTIDNSQVKYILHNFENESSTTYLESLMSDTHVCISNSNEILKINLTNGHVQYLSTDGTYIDKFPHCEYTISNQPLDDNKEIMSLLQERLNVGKYRYGHGVRINDDTNQYGTPDWETMMMEEALDGMIYSAVCLIKIRRNKV